ncbi:MAG: ABC transporter permease [Spirochaetes bacterium]|nr:ABC transporter permease [Spirochaetota bacterium]
MGKIFLIANREFNSVFKNSIMAYILLILYYIITSFLFYTFVIVTNRAELVGVFNNIYVVLLFFIPALTSRSFIDEKKNNTMELLLTSPVTKTEIYLGKFFSYMFFYLIMILPTIIYIIFIFLFGKPQIGVLISSLIGYLLVGLYFICIGLFFSSISPNQVIATILGIIFLLMLLLLTWIENAQVSFKLKEIIKDISYISHLDSFNKGLLDFKDILYFLLYSFFFSFLTISTIDIKNS